MGGIDAQVEDKIMKDRGHPKKLFPVCRVGNMMASREVRGFSFFHFHFCINWDIQGTYLKKTWQKNSSRPFKSSRAVDRKQLFLRVARESGGYGERG